VPSFDVLVQSTPQQSSFRVAAVRGMFDLPEGAVSEHFAGDLQIENKPWHVGVIVGASGSGKSTIAREIFGNQNVACYAASSVVDDMPERADVKEITQAFNSVGFGSPPSWLKPYAVLSSGERMRVDLARALLSEVDPIVFDEFTSVVNREVAKTGSLAVQKAVRRSGRRFVAVSCHRDVLDWLEPDWVYDTDAQEFFFALASIDDPNCDSRFTRSTSRSATPRGDVLASIII
jgi:ABC-type ATPase with predicted acetyltransferase domain